MWSVMNQCRQLKTINFDVVTSKSRVRYQPIRRHEIFFAHFWLVDKYQYLILCFLCEDSIEVVLHSGLKEIGLARRVETTLSTRKSFHHLAISLIDLKNTKKNSIRRTHEKEIKFSLYLICFISTSLFYYYVII